MSIDSLEVDVVSAEADNWPIDELVREYIRTHDLLDIKRREFHELETSLKDILARFSMVLRTRADELGVDSFTVRGVGTAYRNVKTSYTVGDWDSFISYVSSTSNWQLLEKRVAKRAAVEIHNESGKPPPGVQYSAEVTFNVRRT